MANIGGYTDIPDTLLAAQARIVELLDLQKRATEVQTSTLHTLNQALAMIEAGRAALNAVEKP